MTKKTIILSILLFLIILGTIFSDDSIKFNERKTNTLVQYVDDNDYLETEKLTYIVNNNPAYDSLITIYYYKSFDEARIIYSILYRTYDQSEAVIQVRDHLRKFIKEKGFLGYEYLRKDTTKLRKTDDGQIYIDYTAYVRFNK